MNPFFGNIQAPVDGNFDSAIVNIPDGTVAPALIEECKWESYTDQVTGIEATFIKATWSIVDGEYQNRKVFQKIKVMDEKQSTKERALQMLAAIDANAGGKVMAAGCMPDDMLLSMSLCNVPMNITISVWEMNGKSGNYITAVGRLQAPVQQQKPLSQGQAVNQAVAQVQQAQPTAQPTAPQYAQKAPQAPQAQAPQVAGYPQQQPAQFDDIDF